MRETGAGAIGRFVRAGRESLCLVRAKGDALVLETLFLAEDVYSQAEIVEAIEETEVKTPELALAHQIIDSLDGAFEPAELTSSYRRDLRALLEAKLQGGELPPPSEPEAEQAPAVDLLEALKASVAAAKAGAGDRRREAEEAEPSGSTSRSPGVEVSAAALARKPRPAQGASRCSAETPLARAAAVGSMRVARRAAPTASSWAWKRCLSILPW